MSTSTDPTVPNDAGAPTAPPRPRIGGTELVVATISFFVLGIGFLAVLTSIAPSAGVLPLLLVSEVAIAGAAFVALAVRVRSCAALRLQDPGARWLLTGFAAGVGVYLLNRLVVLGWIAVTGNATDPQADLAAAVGAGGWTSVGMLLALVVVTPIAEELLFRGIVYTALRRCGFVVAALGSALLFGLAHGLSVVLAGAVVLGLVNAALFERSRSLWPSIVAHATNNATVVAVVAVVAVFW